MTTRVTFVTGTAEVKKRGMSSNLSSVDSNSSESLPFKKHWRLREVLCLKLRQMKSDNFVDDVCDKMSARCCKGASKQSGGGLRVGGSKEEFWRVEHNGRYRLRGSVVQGHPFNSLSSLPSGLKDARRLRGAWLVSLFQLRHVVAVRTGQCKGPRCRGQHAERNSG